MANLLKIARGVLIFIFGTIGASFSWYVVDPILQIVPVLWIRYLFYAVLLIIIVIILAVLPTQEILEGLKE